MRVADESAVFRSLSRRRVVIRRRVDKVTSLEILDSHSDRKCLVRWDRLPILGEHELGSRDLVGGKDATHRHTIAGPSFDLFSVREWNVLRQTKVDARPV